MDPEAIGRLQRAGVDAFGSDEAVSTALHTWRRDRPMGPLIRYLPRDVRRIATSRLDDDR